MCACLRYQSHPGKSLEVHIKGVVQKAMRHSSFPVVKWAAYFHDLGKINPFFQRKLQTKEVSGYTAHAYLSALAWLDFASKNRQILRQEMKDIVDIYITFMLIVKHHGNLPNIAQPISREHLSQLAIFLKKKPYLPFSDFLKENLGIEHTPFELSESTIDREWLGVFVQKMAEKWKDEPLNYFLETQFAFAALIEGDKRDASNNNYYAFQKLLPRLQVLLPQSLTRKFNSFPGDSLMNQQRTSLRKEAEKSLKKHLKSGKQRLFTLTAPTGAGKTLTLLSLANIIQQKHPGLGIVYALPFLSIIEQTQHIAESLLANNKNLVLPISSKAQDKEMEALIKQLDSDMSEELIEKLLKRDFLRITFDHPFVITTFVQLFETLLSNRNSTLLKLPNLANRIFLIDEIQALPPRLYIFFSAWLHTFCERHNCFAIFSSATMPSFDLPHKPHMQREKNSLHPQSFFATYTPPVELLDYRKYFTQGCFNRYRIIRHVPFEVEDDMCLVDSVLKQNTSCLLIVNTIKDSKRFYRLFKERVSGAPKSSTAKLYLLNTHFTAYDRRRKILRIQKDLKENSRVILVSTQLIEAGVDIDFPVVYRDFCPLPALIQSAGRCNRNNKLEQGGKVFFFHLKKEGKSSAYIVYRDFRNLLNKMEAELFIQQKNEIEEKELIVIQKRFFNHIAKNLSVGDCEIFENGKKNKVNLIELVKEGQFETIGRFRLIQEDTFGESYQYYIPPFNLDFDPYEEAEKIAEQIHGCTDYRESIPLRLKLSQLMKLVQDYTVSIRIPRNMHPPVYSSDSFGIRRLACSDLYNEEYGLDVENAFDQIL